MTKPEKPFSNNLRDVAYIPRWAIARRNRQQYLAEHSYFVTVYADQIARMIDWKGDFAELMRYALYHDLDETVTGDIPGPAKRAAWRKEGIEETLNDVMTRKYGWDICYTRSRATGDAKAIVSAADSIDEVCYLCEEMLSGNTWVSGIIGEACDRLKNSWFKLPAPRIQLDHLWMDQVANIVAEQHRMPVLLKDKI